MNNDPVYQDEFVTLFHGDATQIMPHITGDILLTDPPYGINVVARRKGMPGAQQFDDIKNDDTTEAAEWIIKFWYPRAMYIFGANNFPHLLPEAGIWSCWDKRCSEKADRMFGSPFELAWQTTNLGKQVRMHRIQHGGVVNADGHNIKRIHPTQKPIKLLERIISHLPEGTIIDPFAGSASTLIAARNLQRHVIGIEIDHEHCRNAITRLSETSTQPTLFNND